MYLHKEMNDSAGRTTSAWPRPCPARASAFGKGQLGSALMGSLQIACLLTEGPFGYSRLTYFYLPRSARAYLFPQSVKTHYFLQRPH